MQLKVSSSFPISHFYIAVVGAVWSTAEMLHTSESIMSETYRLHDSSISVHIIISFLGWHSAFNGLLGAHHLNIWKFMSCILDQIQEKDNDLFAMQAANQLRRRN